MEANKHYYVQTIAWIYGILGMALSLLKKR